jgi:hypothetical protein
MENYAREFFMLEEVSMEESGEKLKSLCELPSF